MRKLIVLAEAGQACERFRAGIDPQPPAPAFNQRAEMHRQVTPSHTFCLPARPRPAYLL